MWSVISRGLLQPVISANVVADISGWGPTSTTSVPR